MFTIASYCSEQTATGCFVRCCHNDEFLQTNSAGHHVWLNMPEGSIAEHLEHYLQCKATAPHSTSACILVPARFRTSYKRRLLKGMQLIMQTSLRGVMWHVYYDSALGFSAIVVTVPPQLLTARACRTDSSLLMSFQCIASGIPACVLVDTGASDAYVSSTFVERCGFACRAFSGYYYYGSWYSDYSHGHMSYSHAFRPVQQSPEILCC